jgi:hypothetical protein
MAVKLSALRAGRPLPPGIFLVLISVRDWVNPRAIMQLEELGQLENPAISSGIESATYRLLAWCLNQLRYRVPPNYFVWVWYMVPCLGEGNIFKRVFSNTFRIMKHEGNNLRCNTRRKCVKTTVFWAVTLCNLLDIYRIWGEVLSHIEGRAPRWM